MGNAGGTGSWADESLFYSMTSMAASGQLTSQALQVIHSLWFTGLDFSSPLTSTISKTSTGHVSTQVPHPVHFSKSTFTSTIFFTSIFF